MLEEHVDASLPMAAVLYSYYCVHLEIGVAIFFGPFLKQIMWQMGY